MTAAKDKRGLRLKARWRIARATVRTLIWVSFALLLVSGFFVKVALGHRVVLGWGLGQVRNRVAGSLSVDAISSANLLRGARLIGVRLTTPDGEPFVEVDSLEASYSIGGLLKGALVFDGIRVWGPRVVLERDTMGIDTFGRWVRGERRPPEGPASGGGLVLELHAVGIVDGSFMLRTPADQIDTTSLFRSEIGADGNPRDALDLRHIDAQVSRIELGPEVGIEVDVGRAAAEVDWLQQRFELTEVRAEVRVKDDRVYADLRRFSAPGMAGAGTVLVDRSGAEGMVLDIEAALDEADLREWSWVDDAIPPLYGSVDVRGRLEPGRQRWTASDIDAAWDGGRLAGRATVLLDTRLSLQDVELELGTLPIRALQPYLSRPLDLQGTLDGRLSASGPLDRLQLDGDLVLLASGLQPTRAQFAGGVSLGGEGGALGFRQFRATLDPFDFGLVGRMAPSFLLQGEGRVVAEATGTPAQGLRFTADIGHRSAVAPPSHLRLSGSVMEAGADRLRVDIQGDLSPLSLDALAVDYPEIPLRGTLTGPVRALGLLDDLEIRADLSTRQGQIDLTGRFDARQPGERYLLSAVVDDFLLSALLPTLPDPTRLTGRLEVEGRGLDPGVLVATGRVLVDGAEVAGVHVDSAGVAARVVDGVIELDTLWAALAGFDVIGSGTLAADTAGPAGQLRLAFEAPSLEGIRAVFRGDTVLTADDLTPLDRDVLVLQGIDPDTLPLAAEVVADGRVRGEMHLDGSIRRFSARGWVEGDSLQYGSTHIRFGRVDLEAEGLPGLAGAMHAEMSVDSTVVFDRVFTSGSLTLDFTQPEGRAVVGLVRDSTEEYRLTGGFALDSLGGAVDLEEVAIRIDSLRYRSTHPTRVTWTDSVFAVDSLEMRGQGADPVRIRAAGVLPRRGAADFELDIERLDLRRLARVAQREDLELAGVVDFAGHVRGTAARPEISGQLAAFDLVARNLALDRLEGTVAYANLEVAVGLDAWMDDTRVLRIEGTLPESLALDGSRVDVDDRTIDLTVRADSLPAGLILTLLEDLEDTRGVLSGELVIGGTPAVVEPRGHLRLEGGAWTVGAVGVRQEQVEATFDLRPDRTVEVVASGRSGGTVDVTGTVRLDSLASPGLDLDIVLSSFQAVDRRDIAGAVSGRLELQGTYGQPRVLGALAVERGDLFLEEFSRNVGVVDLSDPRFFAFIDEDILASRPLLAETRNPFMDNLLVNITMAVERNTWLRSRQLTVEMQGDLIVTYDRRSRDVVMVGELEAVRGQYQLIGPVFEVQGGGVEFVGIPGINPNLNIQAEAQVRRQGGEPLVVNAQVGGTLIEPTVQFSTPDAAVSQSDILSYLAVGRPASAFTSGGTSGAVETVTGGVGSFALGSLTSSLSSLAQGSGWLDYLSISQSVDAATLGTNAQSFGRSFLGTQIEVGRYFGGGDYFAALMFRPLFAAGGTGSLLGGARVEWRASEQYHLELFAEDRFLRTGSFGFRDFDIETSLIYGFSLFREWGY